MKKDEKEKIKEKFSLEKLKGMFKDKKGRAKLELSAYFIFFLVIVILARVPGNSKTNNDLEQYNSTSFLNEIKDNYEYNINVTINNNNYEYIGKVLGNNASIKRIDSEEEKYFYVMNNKYYELDSNGNYILTTTDDVYPYINYNYLNISNIKNYLKYSVKENNTYKTKVSDIILNNESNEEIIININEQDKSIDIDYTNILKIDNNNINSATVKIAFSNINTILSLEE